MMTGVLVESCTITNTFLPPPFVVPPIFFVFRATHTHMCLNFSVYVCACCSYLPPPPRPPFPMWALIV